MQSVVLAGRYPCYTSPRTRVYGLITTLELGCVATLQIGAFDR